MVIRLSIVILHQVDMNMVDKDLSFLGKFLQCSKNTKIIFGPTKDSYDHDPQLLPDPVLLLPNWEYCETENIKVGHYGCHFKGFNESD